MESYIFTLNQPDQQQNIKDYIKDNNLIFDSEMELDAGASILFIIKCTIDDINNLKEEFNITLFNGNMQFKQII